MRHGNFGTEGYRHHQGRKAPPWRKRGTPCLLRPLHRSPRGTGRSFGVWRRVCHNGHKMRWLQQRTCRNGLNPIDFTRPVAPVGTANATPAGPRRPVGAVPSAQGVSPSLRLDLHSPSANVARISHRVAAHIMNKSLASTGYWSYIDGLRILTVLGAPWLVFSPSARTCSLASSARYVLRSRARAEDENPAP